MISETRLRPLAKGIGSFALSALRSTHQNSGSASAEHCYNLFMRHLGGIAPHIGGRMPRTLVEIGPGSSLGTGFAALLCGVGRYVALDLQEHRSSQHDREVLAEIAKLLRLRKPFSGSTDRGEHFFPPAPDESLWDLIGAKVDAAIASGLGETLDRELASGTGDLVTYVAPWSDQRVLAENSAEWLMSHSVMEHVDDLEQAYASMAHWLAPGGYATHLIDFSAHTLTKHWNGHWTLGSGMWSLVRGRRPYLINRQWRSRHLEIMRDHGFEVVSETTFEREGGWPKEALKQPFAHMPSGDERIGMSFVVARKL